MATYAVGDVQGCFDTFLALLRAIEFDPDRDRLWLTGDLVNRGPKSVDVLRWAYAHDACVTAVLGNHDVHLLARALVGAKSRSKDTFGDVLRAPDRAVLLAWLQSRPLVHEEGDFLLLHAGVLPAWDRSTLLEVARSASERLGGEDFAALLGRLSTKRSVRWTPGLGRDERDEAAIRILCNLRTCDVSGQPAFDYAGPPADAPPDRIPWFSHSSRRSLGATVVCGHWAAQGLVQSTDMIALDTAAVWGGTLTAVDLATGRSTSVALVDEVPAPRR